VLKIAIPLALTGTCPITVVPSTKVTWPVGVPEPGGSAATVAVKETWWPGADGFAEEVSVVVDALA